MAESYQSISYKSDKNGYQINNQSNVIDALKFYYKTEFKTKKPLGPQVPQLQQQVRSKQERLHLSKDINSLFHENFQSFSDETIYQTHDYLKRLKIQKDEKQLSVKRYNEDKIQKMNQVKQKQSSRQTQIVEQNSKIEAILIDDASSKSNKIEAEYDVNKQENVIKIEAKNSEFESQQNFSPNKKSIKQLEKNERNNYDNHEIAQKISLKVETKVKNLPGENESNQYENNLDTSGKLLIKDDQQVIQEILKSPNKFKEFKSFLGLEMESKKFQAKQSDLLNLQDQEFFLNFGLDPDIFKRNTITSIAQSAQNKPEPNATINKVEVKIKKRSRPDRPKQEKDDDIKFEDNSKNSLQTSLNSNEESIQGKGQKKEVIENTKNLIKNYGQAQTRFIQLNQYSKKRISDWFNGDKELMDTFLRWASNQKLENFEQFKQIWHVEHGEEKENYKDLYRLLCYDFYWKHASVYVFGSQMRSQDARRTHIKFIYRFLEGLFDPSCFYYFKKFDKFKKMDYEEIKRKSEAQLNSTLKPKKISIPVNSQQVISTHVTNPNASHRINKNFKSVQWVQYEEKLQRDMLEQILKQDKLQAEMKEAANKQK